MGIATDVIKRIKSISRYNQILRVLIKYGFEDLVQYLENNRYYTFFQRLLPDATKKHINQYNKWARMRLVCEELGPTFIKFGQILSNRPDLVPLELTLELEKLQDHVPPMPEKVVKSLVEAELKDTTEHLFAWFEPKPFASASIAQVHKVTLHSGERVALKVQRSGIFDIVVEDIKVMYRVARVLEKRIPTLKSFNPIELVKHFESSILKELDFIHESINAQRFYNNLAKDHSLDQYALAPKVYQEFTTSKVLALEFISGIKISKIAQLKAKQIDTKVIARRLSISYYKQIFEYGFFHADPHPGNLLVLPNNHICYLDFGMMGSILPRDILIFRKLFTAITRKNVKKIIKVLIQLSNDMPIPDMRALEFDVNEFIESYYVKKVHENEMSTILLELKNIIVKHRLKVPVYFFLFARSLVTIEGVIKKLDPNLKQMDIVKPYLQKSIAQDYNPLKIGEKLINSTADVIDFMGDFPRDLKNAIRKINSGEISVDINHKGIDPLVHTLQRVTKQLIAVFVMLALIAGASLFVIFKIEPLWKGISALGILCFSFAIFLGLGMLLNIRKGDYDY
ncbi:ABC1 kinase family protein [Mangrovimonas spongiae]|uniref:ABC1 atypical kinase-like domain-containing protein n=1 Tax=Mangrovimonas spongiae TaxID=2494697 RepID=A0A3R9P060_9FLAO|nr:AarF/UbiB family protein [Mangrovimonas spongiae]RSK41401.1 hypothetical protein EJA19_00575 [Mangrovimonas spongiae]